MPAEVNMKTMAWFEIVKIDLILANTSIMSLIWCYMAPWKIFNNKIDIEHLQYVTWFLMIQSWGVCFFGWSLWSDSVCNSKIASPGYIKILKLSNTDGGY